MPAVIPLVAAGISAAGSAYSAHKKANAEKQAQAQAQPLITAQTGLANQLAGQSAQTFGAGMPLVGAASSYYGSLLNGNRSSLRLATLPQRQEISDTYSGAQRGLERSGLRGASRDQAQAELGRSQATQLSSLVPNARNAAAGAVGSLGTGLLSASAGAASGAGNLFSSLLGNQLDMSKFAQQQKEYSDKQSSDFGSSLASLFTNVYGAYTKSKGGAGGATSL